jgi:DNA-binding ferritin-like protein
MPNLKLLARVRDLRTRAEEILAKAETMTDADARDMMRAVAASYEKLAQRLEQEADEA